MNRCMLQNKTVTLLTLIFLASFQCTVPLQAQDAVDNILYVNAASNATNPDGSSWAKAFKDLQSAVDAAYVSGGGELWVAAGTYTGTTEPIMTMKEGVALYGGFSGKETAKDERNWEAHKTIIDGETERRCVRGADNAVLDGFIITRGFAGPKSLKDDEDCMCGGGMLNYGFSPTVANCVFKENGSNHNGAGMSNQANSSPTIKNCTFESNHCPGVGTGMYNQSSSPIVIDCLFTDHDAYGWGGGMSNEENSSPTISNCIFRRNTIYAGFGGGAIYNWSSSPIIINCLFENNSTHENTGGAIGNKESSPIIRNCTFLKNTANGGGAIGNQMSSPTITNSIFIANRSTDSDGGAISNYSSSSPEVINCIFEGNIAKRYGGGIENSFESCPKLINCTFADNVAEDGAGIHSEDDCSSIVKNCIFWSSSAQQISNLDTSTVSISYSCIRGGYEGIGNISENPLFAGTGEHTLKLSSGSPCIDSGTDKGAPENDILGRLRPQGSGFDMGAYEYSLSVDENDKRGVNDDGKLPNAVIRHLQREPWRIFKKK